VKDMTGIAVNDAPVLVNNSLTIVPGGSVIISSANLSATDVDNDPATLTFAVSGVSGGRFEFVSSPGVAITAFTQSQVSGGAVRFVDNSGAAAPAYEVSVSDGALSYGPAAATINFLTQNNPSDLGDTPTAPLQTVQPPVTGNT